MASNRRISKGIRQSFIRNALDNGYSKHDAKRLFKEVWKLSRLQEKEARRLGIPMEGAWWVNLDNERLGMMV